ncbi:MAG: hypothetical protein IKJ24_00535 [Clostridia bacterium]|nr:hypothetical protein [Clostridia bacterium]
MVKKLFKHEFIYYFRTFGIFLPIVLATAIAAKIFTLFDQENVFNEIVTNISILALVMASFGLLALSAIISVIRFYKNMYSAEGYLTFTLPASNSQHIFVKLCTAMIWQISCFITVVLAWSIMLIGGDSDSVSGEIVGAELWNEFVNTIGAGNLVAYAIELVIAIFAAMVYSMLLAYTCITIGQTAKKHRIGKAVGVYFIYYYATQAILSVLSTVGTVLATDSMINSSISEMTIDDTVVLIHIVLCGAIVICAAVSLVFWLVTRYVMTKKLNLE